MDQHEDPIGELVRLLGRLPGIGERTATRLAFYLITEGAEYSQALGQALSKLHGRVRRCARCGNFASTEECNICRDPRRDTQLVAVVARVQDLMALERAGLFRGRYHVLHGLLAPLDGMGPERLDLDRLIDRIRHEGITEIVLATPLSVEGEATALYVADSLRSLSIKVSRIASGLPHGGELEFADQVTLGRAFEGRRSL